MKFILISLFFLVSCAVGPDYKKQELPEYNFQENGKSEFFSSEENLSPWWKLYEDQNINSIVEEALKANKDLKIAGSNLARAEALILEYQGQRLPTTTATASAVRAVSPSAGAASSQQPLNGPYPTMYTYDYGLSLSWDLDIFGRLRRGVEFSRAEAEASKMAYNVAKINMIANTIRAYVDSCSYGRQIVVAKKIIQMQDDGYKLIEKSVKAGRGTQLDLSRTAGQLAQVKALLPPLEAAKRLALYRLAVLLGKNPNEYPKNAETCETLPQMTALIPVGDGTKLLMRRPDVWLAERKLASATASIGIAKSLFYPTLSFGASAGYSSHEGHTFGTDPSERFSIGPLISWSIPNMTLAKSRLNQAKAGSDAALANYEQTILNALRDTESSMATFHYEIEKNKVLVVAKDEGAKAVFYSRKMLAAGATGFLEVLDAERSLANVESLLAISDSQVTINRINLFLSLGGGW